MNEEQYKILKGKYDAASASYSLTGKGEHPDTSSEFKEFRQAKQTRSDQASDQFKGVSEDSLISKAGARDTFTDESTGVAGNMKFNELTEPILNKTGVDMTSTNVADNPASITNTGNSNFKQTADMGSAFDSSSDTYDESEFSWLDGMQRKGNFKLNTRGDENEKSRSLSLLNNTNQNENALDVSYKNKAEQDVIKSTGKAVEERNFMSSKTRGGLFGNYGKQVKINKIVDPNTGKVNREKYVDGKLTKSTAEKDRFKREKKSGRETGRANKK
jgi:hypothetical protein